MTFDFAIGPEPFWAAADGEAEEVDVVVVVVAAKLQQPMR